MVKRKKDYSGEKTEAEVKAVCNKQNFYSLKLQVDKSRINSATGKVLASPMPSDFLVVGDALTALVEVKEVLNKQSFANSRFRQQYKLTTIANKHSKDKFFDCLLLINFVAYETIVCLPVLEYNELLQKSGKKSLNIKDFPEYYKRKDYTGFVNFLC